MAISKDKRRVTLSLTAVTLDRFQVLCDELGLPNTTLSSACDDVLNSLTEQWEVVAEKKRNGGTYGLSEFIALVGAQLTNLFETEKEKKRGRQERNQVSNT